MRARRLFTTLLVAPALVAMACGARGPSATAGTPSVPAVDASPDTSVTARRCTPWVDPEQASTKAPDPVDPEDANRDRHTKPQDPKQVCAVADSNLARAEAAIVPSAGGPMAAHVAWDHKKPPARLDLVDRRFALTKRERSLLATNGFVVMSRRSYSTYAWGLHDVFQSQLPIYVSADAILHAVYASNDHLLAQIETSLLVPLLGRSLSAMHCALAEAATSYPPEVARDLDVYLTVARSLLADAPVPSVLGSDSDAAALVASAKKASGIVTVGLFGRDRLIDWSQYEPRGHYAGPTPPPDDEAAAAAAAEPAAGPSLTAYFRAAMWLSRIEMNLVSRSSRSSSPSPAPDPSETPREAIAAVALADLVDRAHAVDDVARLDRAWTLLAGRREDVTMGELLKLRQKAGVGKIELAAFDKLKAAIGNDYQRTARLHPMPEGSTVLPAIATLLGPRVVADTAAFRPLVHSEVGGRYLVSSGDVAYVLGLDHGKTYLAADVAQFPQLASHLEVARGVLKSAPDAGDLYGAWLNALRGVAAPPAGVVPSFMTTPAYDDLRVNTLVAGYGQIRHNYVLMAGQSYDEGGCEIPDGWVEPLPRVYDGIAAYASRGAAALKELDPKDRTGSIAYFTQLGKVARVLTTISKHELEGRALTEEDKRFLGMVVEMTPGSSGGGPTYTGWYFDLFRGRVEEGLATAAFTADYHTSSYLGKVVYAGATGPRMGVFVVDAGGPPRVMVGPVARAYELVGTTAKRFNDETGVMAPDKRDPWAASYTADAPAAPAFAFAASMPYEKKFIKVILKGGPVALPRVVIEALDHHSVAIGSVTRALAANARITFTIPTTRLAEGARIRIGDYSFDDLAHGAGDAGGVSVVTTKALKIEDDDWTELSQ